MALAMTMTWTSAFSDIDIVGDSVNVGDGGIVFSVVEKKSRCNSVVNICNAYYHFTFLYSALIHCTHFLLLFLCSSRLHEPSIDFTKKNLYVT